MEIVLLLDRDILVFNLVHIIPTILTKGWQERKRVARKKNGDKKKKKKKKKMDYLTYVVAQFCSGGIK